RPSFTRAVAAHDVARERARIARRGWRPGRGRRVLFLASVMSSPATGSDAPAVSLAEPERFGGASAGKIGMWVFLVTDGMGFAGMLIAYGVLRAGAAVWPDPPA